MTGHVWVRLVPLPPCVPLPDGGRTVALAAYVFSIAVYITVTIPALQTIVTPLPDVDTREDQVGALSVLSAGNVIIMFLLGAILVLQVRLDTVRVRCAFPMLT